MKKKIIIIAVAVLLILAYFFYPKIKNVFPEKTVVLDKSTRSDDTGDHTSDQSASASSENAKAGDTVAPDINISPSDCDNQCAKYSNSNELEYCQQVCGLTPDNSNINSESASDNTSQSSNCDSKVGIQKDYCLKDESISAHDFTLCDQINDAQVKNTCQNRITEDILESQNNSSQ